MNKKTLSFNIIVDDKITRSFKIEYTDYVQLMNDFWSIIAIEYHSDINKAQDKDIGIFYFEYGDWIDLMRSYRHKYAERCIQNTWETTHNPIKLKIFRNSSFPMQIVSKNIIVWKNKYGQYHRDNDLPAIEYTDGSKIWYQNGLVHRDNDKPAFIGNNGTKNWYQNGKLHRETGPAIKTSSEVHRWYIEGKELTEEEFNNRSFKKVLKDRIEWRNSKGEFHRDNDKPAIEWGDGSKEWYKNGKLHRDNDKPAIEWSNGSKWWYQNGKIHRDNDLPAVEWTGGNKEWYQHGKLHRDNDSPAVECPNGYKAWYQHGERHRDNDLPAIIRSDGSKAWFIDGKELTEERFNNRSFKKVFDDRTEWRNSKGELHRDNDLPAIEFSDGTKRWYQHGLEHRDNDKPAIERMDGAKFWYQNGKLHRDNDKPAIIDSNGTKYWYQNGLLHSDNDKPAIKYSDGAKHWYQNGKLHRDNDKPAIIKTTGRKEWCVNGQYHRETGPAIENFAGLMGQNRWFVNGREYTEKEFNEKFNDTIDCKVLSKNSVQVSFKKEDVQIFIEIDDDKNIIVKYSK